MTGHDDFDRALTGWFEADALSPAPAGALDRVLDATRRRRPQPARLAGFGSHWVGEATADGSSSGGRSLPRMHLRWSTVLILILVTAAFVGGAMLVGALLLQPSPLPTGRLGQLAYALDGDIFVADWDGGNPVRIADGAPPGDSSNSCGPGDFSGPMWSPDGRHLAYHESWESCQETVAISDLEIGSPVASFPGTGVSWSPDSTRLATWVEPSETIGIYGIDGARQALLTAPPCCDRAGDNPDPMWSPDGKSLMVRLSLFARLWELPIDGGPPRPVPDEDPRSHFDAVYSHDGARVAFTYWPDDPALVIAKADGTELRVVSGAVNGPNGTGHGAAYQAYENPVVSPTGDRVAFIWHLAFYYQRVDPSSNDYELRVVDVASGKVTTMASATSASGVFPFDSITFSPEGDRVLFRRQAANDVTSLWSVHADGSDAQPLVMGADWGDWQSLPAGP